LGHLVVTYTLHVPEIDISKLRVKPGDSVSLKKMSPSEEFGLDREAGEARLTRDAEQLEELQYQFFADARRSMLVVLQGIDTAGKDGTIRRVISAFNPQGVYVKSFKAPAGQETYHDFLWRVHAACPPRGSIAIFNRSHYEDVFVNRVHRRLPDDVLDKRLRHINNFEQMLADEGTIIIKLFLNISKSEQLARLRARLNDSTRNWKFNGDDLRERARWKRYVEVFEDTLSATSTTTAPWWVIPSDRKWVRNLAVSEILKRTLESLKLGWPRPDASLAKFRKDLG
jgi:PPK2 family polyphosphate:nucleotide phosphotransferase